MSKPPISPSRGGIAGMLLLFAVAAGAAGLVFDFTSNSDPNFWVLENPGARAALGAGAALTMALCAHLVRWVLGRKVRSDGEARDAQLHR